MRRTTPDLPSNINLMAGVTSDYEKWRRDQDFSRAQRQGRVQYVVHIHTGDVQVVHTHVHYDGGPLLRQTPDGDEYR